MRMGVDYRGLGGGRVLGKCGGHQVVRRARALFLVVLSHGDGGVCEESEVGDAMAGNKS